MLFKDFLLASCVAFDLVRNRNMVEMFIRLCLVMCTYPSGEFLLVLLN